MGSRLIMNMNQCYDILAVLENICGFDKLLGQSAFNIFNDSENICKIIWTDFGRPLLGSHATACTTEAPNSP